MGTFFQALKHVVPGECNSLRAWQRAQSPGFDPQCCTAIANNLKGLHFFRCHYVDANCVDVDHTQFYYTFGTSRDSFGLFFDHISYVVYLQFCLNGVKKNS